MIRGPVFFVLTLLQVGSGISQGQSIRFQKLTLSNTFYAEGAAYGDLNRDGIADLVAGPYWYQGPGFDSLRREIYPPKAFDANAYSDNFFAFVKDIDGDGWNDVVVIGFPGTDAAWFRNPKSNTGTWTKYVMVAMVDNEAPTFGDLTGDGKPELIYSAGGILGWAGPNPADAKALWTFHPISTRGDWFKFTHGLGYGDVNGDGRADLLEKAGWWEQPASLAGDPVWTRHAYAFATDAANADGGGSQMYAYDVDGDGDNDVIAALQAHGWGLAWFENITVNGAITFTKRMIMGTRAEIGAYGAAFSQPHSLALVDLDADGVKDLVSGKRWWAHGPSGDPEPNAEAVLYAWKLRRTAGQAAQFDPVLIDNNSGSGTQLTTGDFSGDGHPDIVISNKKGTFAFTRTGVEPLTLFRASGGRVHRLGGRFGTYDGVGRRFEFNSVSAFRRAASPRMLFPLAPDFSSPTYEGTRTDALR